MVDPKEPPKRRAKPLPKAATPSPTASTKPASTKPASTKPASAKPTSTKKGLPILSSAPEPTALQASWPEAVLALTDDDRKARVRQGQDTVLLDEIGADGARKTRGFVRAVLRVPLAHPQASVYGVFVEVDRDAYLALRRAFVDKRPVSVWGTLATRLPFLDDAYGTAVQIVEDGSDLRARVTDVKSESLRHGPAVGPRMKRGRT